MSEQLYVARPSHEARFVRGLDLSDAAIQAIIDTALGLIEGDTHPLP